MQLSFRGKPYEASFPSVEAIETDETVTFLGKPCSRKQYNVAQRYQPTQEMMYRGVRYHR